MRTLQKNFFITLCGLFLVSSVHAAQPKLDDIIGSYAGCGEYSAFGRLKMVFHLLKLPTNATGEEKLSASFQWADKNGDFGILSGVFYETVEFDAANSRIFMKTEIAPRKDYGRIIKTLMIEVLSDGTLKGAYRTNSMLANGTLGIGDWEAKRLPEGVLPTDAVNCN